jgi:hypothetical protein
MDYFGELCQRSEANDLEVSKVGISPLLDIDFGDTHTKCLGNSLANHTTFTELALPVFRLTVWGTACLAPALFVV